jgi:deoxycytidylate deaminase
METRPTWHEYFMEMAYLASKNAAPVCAELWGQYCKG